MLEAEKVKDEELIAVGPHKAAAILGISRTKVYELARDRELAYFKSGRRTLFLVDELKRWARAQAGA